MHLQGELRSCNQATNVKVRLLKTIQTVACVGVSTKRYSKHQRGNELIVKGSKRQLCGVEGNKCLNNNHVYTQIQA